MIKLLEVPAFSIESALAAQTGGADRIELCSGFLEGGLTPSYAMILSARKYLNIPFFVMIRPHGGDFLYSDTDFEMMRKDIRTCKEIMADGVVFGMLDEQGRVDKIRCSALVEMAKPLTVTFHRAFDMVSDPFKSLEDIISCGFSRILTSGLQQNAIEGAEMISALIKIAGNRISIMPGSGINAGNLPLLIHKTNAIEFHASCKALKESQMKYRKQHIRMSAGETTEFQKWETSIEKVKELKSILVQENKA